jgi:hypothetical protein
MARRAADLLLAVLLLSLAFPAVAHVAALLGLAALDQAAHHWRALLAAAAVVTALRAVPRPSARLLELLLGTWAVRLVLAGLAAA